MKLLFDLLPSAVKAIITVCAFLVTLGWASYAAISSMVEDEVHKAKEEMKEIRHIDIEHIDKRFDRLEQLIREE